MATKRSIKYNAAEVQISRSVVALFIYLALMASVWGVRRLYRAADFLVYITAGVLLAAFGVTLFLWKKQQKAGVLPGSQPWGMDFWCYLCASAATAHLLLVLTKPVEFWKYTAPIIYVMLILHYLLYVTAIDRGKNFLCFGFLAATAGLGMMGMYQTYYNSVQNTISTHIISHQDAYTVGWVVMAAATVAILLISKKKKVSFWKQLSVVGIFAAYWGVLQLGWGTGYVVTLIFGGILAVWYVLLRVLQQIKVIA
ncbi:MAG: hypothetical protein IJN42_05165 [Clostridia bacterium]|nr:hypothetical protein [Clostridia bacterium]